jgi:hypothetical protein
MTKAMVWYFVSDTHKVMTTLIFVILVLVLLALPEDYLQSICEEFPLQ